MFKPTRRYEKPSAKANAAFGPQWRVRRRVRNPWDYRFGLLFGQIARVVGQIGAVGGGDGQHVAAVVFGRLGVALDPDETDAVAPKTARDLRARWRRKTRRNRIQRSGFFLLANPFFSHPKTQPFATASTT